jgi:predicted Fe-S protein YdhL (DUF1289 family)
MSVLAMRMCMADPKPAYCSTCWAAASDDVEFVDTRAAYEGPTVRDPDTGALLLSVDDIYICTGCVREMCETANVKPTLHVEQEREITKLRELASHWQSRAEALEKVIASGRPESVKKRR